jgi:hypothetical protein
MTGSCRHLRLEAAARIAALRSLVIPAKLRRREMTTLSSGLSGAMPCAASQGCARISCAVARCLTSNVRMFRTKSAPERRKAGEGGGGGAGQAHNFKGAA